MGGEGENPSHQKVPCLTYFSLLPLSEILRLCLDERNLKGGKGRRQEAGGLSAQRRLLMMLLFWSLLAPPHPIPELGWEREKERSAGKREAMALAVVKILYLGSSQRSRVCIFKVEMKISGLFF